MSSHPKTSPDLLQQHKALKQRYPDALCLFRVGDRYETFDDDAFILLKILGKTIHATSRNSFFHAEFDATQLDENIAHLVKAGHKVAVCA